METVTIKLSGKADEFLEGSSLAQQTPDETGYPAFLHHAYDNRKVRKVGTGYVAEITLPATKAGADAIDSIKLAMEAGYDGARDNSEYSTMDGLRKSIDRCTAAIEFIERKLAS